jgi:tetratricopeptide (TPR) repeat protein
MAQQDSTGEDEQEAKAYIRSGNDRILNNDFQGAIENFIKGLEIAGKRGNIKQPTTYSFKSGVETAIECLKKALEIASDSGGEDKELEMDTLIGLGHAHRLNRQLERANQHCQEVLHIANKLGDTLRANKAMGVIEKLPPWIVYKRMMATHGKLQPRS